MIVQLEWAPDYFVTDQGEVLSTRTGKMKPLKPGINTSGYYNLSLAKGRNIYRTYMVHTLVAGVFLGPRPEGMQINHKDGNKLNNVSDNLEYVTKSRNVRHSWEMGLRTKQRIYIDTEFVKYGEANIRAKLSKSQVLEIFHKKGKTSAAKTGRLYGINPSTVARIWSGKYWAHVTQSVE